MNRKYTFTEGKAINSRTGIAIPDDEPTLLLRASDVYALRTIADYQRTCRHCSPEFLEDLDEVLADFRKFEETHMDRMKKPN